MKWKKAMAQLLWNPTCQCRRHKRCGFNSWVGKISWKRDGNSLQYSCLENFRQRSLVGYSLRGCKESDMTELLTLLLSGLKWGGSRGLKLQKLSCQQPERTRSKKGGVFFFFPIKQPDQHFCDWNLKFSMKCSTLRSQFCSRKNIEMEPRARKKSMWTHTGEAEQQADSRRQNRGKMGIKYSDERSVSFNLPSVIRIPANGHWSDRKNRNEKKMSTLKVGWYRVYSQ